jgi:hypothetical protein
MTCTSRELLKSGVGVFYVSYHNRTVFRAGGLGMLYPLLLLHNTVTRTAAVFFSNVFPSLSFTMTTYPRNLYSHSVFHVMRSGTDNIFIRALSHPTRFMDTDFCLLLVFSVNCFLICPRNALYMRLWSHLGPDINVSPRSHLYLSAVVTEPNPLRTVDFQVTFY